MQTSPGRILELLCFTSVLAAAGCDEPSIDAEDWQVDDEADGEPDGEPAVDDAEAVDELAQGAGTAYPGECRIVALGDSITYGYNGNTLQRLDPYGTFNGGYRAHLVASFQQAPSPTVGPIRMVGARYENGTPLLYAWNQAAHSGYEGWTSPMLAGAVSAYGVTTFSPAADFVLLHSGTNDIRISGDHQTALAGLNVLLDALKTKNPGATILLAKIIPMTGIYAYLNGQVNLYNAGLDAFAAARRLAGQDVYTVDHNTFFPTATIEDGLHPNWTGYADMAARWRLALDAHGCAP